MLKENGDFGIGPVEPMDGGTPSGNVGNILVRLVGFRWTPCFEMEIWEARAGGGVGQWTMPSG